MGKTLSCSLAHAMSQKGLRMALPHMVADLWEPHRGRRGFVTLRLLGSMMTAPSVNGCPPYRARSADAGALRRRSHRSRRCSKNDEP